MQPMNTEGFAQKFQNWLDVVSNLHQGFQFQPNDRVHWTALSKPLSECRIALVTTAGVHRKDQDPFDMVDHSGDPSYREIGGDIQPGNLMVTHDHYSHADADQDINCVFPIERLRDLAATGEIGSVSPLHFGLMGFVMDTKRLVEETAAHVSKRLHQYGVDIAIFTPG